MPIALLIALLVGGSTSVVAEGSVPGDALYPVKVNVNEEVRSWFSMSDQAKAEWNSKRAEKRLEEAEKLAIEGRLDSKTRAEIAANFEENAKAVNESLNKIEEAQDTKTAFEISSDLEASLTAHEQILTQLASDRENVRSELNLLLNNVRTQLSLATQERLNIEARASVNVDENFKAMAEKKQEQAEDKLDDARNFLEKKKANISAEAYVRAQTELNTATEIVAQGKSEVEAGAYGKAFTSFQQAIRSSQKVKLLIAIEDKIDVEVKIPSIHITAEQNIDGQGTTSKGYIEASSSINTQIDNESSNTNVKGQGKIDLELGL